MPILPGSKTFANLKYGFNIEAQGNLWYSYFARQADIEGFSIVSDAFREVALSETGHAFGHLEFMKEAGEDFIDRPIGGTKQNIITTIIGEKHDYTDVYPGFARIAREEGFDEIAEWFETLVKAEKSHTVKLTKSLSTM